MARKEQIRVAAVKVIAEEGFFNATTDKIAKEAQVAVGTLYNYFSSKEDILNYIFDVEFQKRYGFYQKLKDSKMDWLAKIIEILKFHFQEIEREPDIVRIVLSEKINANRGKLISLEKFAQLPAIITEILQIGIDEGKIKECNIRIVALMIFGFIEAVMGEFLATKDVKILENGITEISNLLEEGIRK